MPAIGELNSKIYLVQFQGQTADGAGGLTTGGTAIKRTFWAEVKEARSSREDDQGQQVLNKRYTINARYNRSAGIVSGNYIIYEGKVLVVTGEAITVHNEFIEISAQQRSIAADVVPSIPELGSYGLFRYDATGGETEIVSDAIKYKDIILLFEEGVSYQVQDDVPGRLLAQYVPSAGKIAFDHALQPGEIVMSFYQYPATVPDDLNRIAYTATGGEGEFTDPELLGKRVYFVFEEGSALWVDNDNPGRMQAQYIDNVDVSGVLMGKIKLDHTLQPGEIIQVLYQ